MNDIELLSSLSYAKFFYQATSWYIGSTGVHSTCVYNLARVRPPPGVGKEIVFLESWGEIQLLAPQKFPSISTNMNLITPFPRI